MTKMSFAKGIGLGLLVGSAVAVAIPHRKHSHKRTIGKALRTVGEVIENVSDAIGI